MSPIKMFPLSPIKAVIGFSMMSGVAIILANIQNEWRKSTNVPTIKATCHVGPNGKPCNGVSEFQSVASGLVTFIDRGDKCLITYKISGLTPGKHGFHIHETSDFSNGCVSAGPHYNPEKVAHGGPGDKVRHVGDLGNIVANDSGVAEGAMIDEFIKLAGEYSVVGRSIMVHADADDLGQGGHELSCTTGNAGARVACGEIQLDSL